MNEREKDKLTKEEKLVLKRFKALVTAMKNNNVKLQIFAAPNQLYLLKHATTIQHDLESKNEIILSERILSKGYCSCDGGDPDFSE